MVEEVAGRWLILPLVLLRRDNLDDEGKEENDDDDDDDEEEQEEEEEEDCFLLELLEMDFTTTCDLSFLILDCPRRTGSRCTIPCTK